MQLAAFSGMQIYRAPEDIGQMLRPTTRKEIDRIHVMSLGVIAEKEKDFRSFLALMSKRKAVLVETDSASEIHVCPGNYTKLVKDWKEARKNGVAKIGGRISADNRKKESAEAAAKIKDRWPMPSKIWPTRVLLKEAGKSLNTIKSILGPRPIAQYNYQAKLKRKAKKAGRHE